MIKEDALILEFDPFKSDIINNRKLRYEGDPNKLPSLNAPQAQQQHYTKISTDDMIRLEIKLNDELKIELLN